MGRHILNADTIQLTPHELATFHDLLDTPAAWVISPSGDEAREACRSMLAKADAKQGCVSRAQSIALQTFLETAKRHGVRLIRRGLRAVPAPAPPPPPVDTPEEKESPMADVALNYGQVRELCEGVSATVLERLIRQPGFPAPVKDGTSNQSKKWSQKAVSTWLETHPEAVTVAKKRASKGTALSRLEQRVEALEARVKELEAAGVAQ